ncbi:hypothetical protein GALL_167340 [mine drainage metagenome]|uniref:DUF3825 domain-containing protein n=1 Tax=mine drainage metagenome TaxID=410659 RepID=A0A1J5SMH7_9ZZZZ
MAVTEVKDALRSFAFIKDFHSIATRLNAICGSANITTAQIINSFKLDKLTYHSKAGNIVASESAEYARYDSGFVDKSGNKIFGHFTKKAKGQWIGIEFGYLNYIKSKFDTFDCGFIKITPFKSANIFFNGLSEMAIPESWEYSKTKSTVAHPILKSYIENTFHRLVQEQKNGAGKIILNNTHLLFNTGLLDKFFHAIYIIAERSKQDDTFHCCNPVITTSLAKLKEFGGFQVDGKSINKKEMLPKPAEFFKNLNEVVFNIDLEVDKDFHKFEHMIQENRIRFEKYPNDTTEQLARRVDSAIDSAILMAERNYKFIVPQYRPTENKIQFLMPLYLDGQFDDAPDLALVLDFIEDLYVPETVLSLDSAYQNARLIAKPDTQWLDPYKIQTFEDGE